MLKLSGHQIFCRLSSGSSFVEVNSKEMKLHCAFVFFFFWSEVESSQQDRKSKLERAFLGIAEDLAKQNHLVSVFTTNNFNKATEDTLNTAFAGVPHIALEFSANK